MGVSSHPHPRSRLPATMAIPEFKLILCGDGSTGKTTFVKRHITGEYEKKYIATVGCCVHPLQFTTSRGVIQFNTWDTAGQEKLSRLRDAYYIHGQCAIIMFDLTARVTYNNVPEWYRGIQRVCGHIPMVLCGNKVDIPDRKVKVKSINFHHKKNINYYDISAKTNYQYHKPFLHLASKLLQDPHLQLQKEAAIQPPEVQVDQNLMAKYQEELRQVKNAPVIEDNDDDDF